MKCILFVILVFTSFSALAQIPLLPQTDDSNSVIRHTAYTLAYNERHEQPQWVYYLLTREHALAEMPRKDSFKADKSVATGSATPADYKGSGYDKGHLAPCADMRWDKTVMEECFLMSNMSPQSHGFNAGIWSRMEEQVRQWAITYDSLHVITGPVLSQQLVVIERSIIHCKDTLCDTLRSSDTLIDNRGDYPTIGANQVSVPRYFFKVVYNARNMQALGFLVPHANTKESLKAFAVPVELIEEATGINFFAPLPDDLEEALENSLCIPCWQWN